MSTQVLARKWRPRSFSTLVGQEHVVKALHHALENQRLHHAYLFTGTRGVGKTTIARILAKAVNCEVGVSATPCGECRACLDIDQGRFVDLLEVDAATNTKVDEMRALLDNALYAPTSGRYKVYVIDEVHMLSNSAFNAMLKTLEEPPPHILFILATTDPQKIPPTVLSRCLQFNLKQMPAERIIAHLQNVLASEGVAFETAALAPLAHAAQGSMRDALSLTDQAIAYSAGELTVQTVRNMLGSIDAEQLFDILRALARRDGGALLDIARHMTERSLPVATALQDLAGLAYRLSVAQQVPSAIDADYQAEVLHELAGLLAPDTLQLVYQIANHARAELHLAPDEATGFGMALLRMLAFVPAAAASPTQPAVKPASATIPPPATIAPTRAAQPLVDQPVVPAPIKATTAAPDFPEPAAWPERVGRMAVSGLAGQCLQQSEWVGAVQQGDTWLVTLRVPVKTYAEPAFAAKIEHLLQQFFATPLKLKMEIGDVDKTASAARAAQRHEQQRQAESAVADDSFLNDLKSQMGAVIVQGSVRSLA
jgi:DNA polymerase-3 subunit gamma/tau